MKPCLYTLLCFLFFNTSAVFSQGNPGTLSGKVRDSLARPVSFATVSLYKPQQLSAPLKSTYTGTDGAFKLKADTGNYILIVSHSGYSNTSTNIHIQPGDNVTEDILLGTVVRSLQNVTVTIRKPLIEQSDDKIVYNVESDPAAKSENATDLLRKTPLVTVDGDGNVQLNGQSNFKILLNGRETSMFANNVKDALKNFPGAVISKIEVITSPSAKYDAEGVGGIINIITKKKVIGYNGYLSSYYSTLTNYSENLSLNVKSGKIGMSAFIGTNGSTGDINGSSMSETTPFGNAVFTKRTLNGQRSSRNFGTYGNLEIVYDIDSFKTIATYGNLGGFRNQSTLDQSIITEHGVQASETSLFMQQSRSSNPNYGFGSDFTIRFRNKPDKELTFRFNGQFSRNNGSNSSFQDNPVQDRYVNNNSFSRNREYTMQVDLSTPLKGKQKIETGIKGILRNASSDFESLLRYNSNEDFKPNPSNSDRFNYHQEVFSAYTSYSFPLKKYNIRTGVRLEHTDVNGDFETAKTIVKQNYNNIIPNLFVTRKFSNLYSLTGSYNMRLQRPYITSLNPFVNNNDSLNISYGNPNLGPQILHAVQLQNRFTKGKLFASVNLNAAYTNTMIVQYVSFNQSTGVTSTTSANVGKEFQAGIGFNINSPVGEKLTLGAFTQLKYNHVQNKSNLLQQNKGISGAAFGNFNYKVIGQFTITGSGGVMRNTYALVNSPSTQYFYQVNFGYKLMKEKLSVTVNVNNFHDRYMQYKNVTEDPRFRIVSSNISPYRVIYFGATYNFGKLKENVSKKKGVTNDDLVQ